MCRKSTSISSIGSAAATVLHRPDLRTPCRQTHRLGRSLWRSPRSLGYDDSRRHQHGYPCRGRTCYEGWLGTDRAIEDENVRDSTGNHRTRWFDSGASGTQQPPGARCRSSHARRWSHGRRSHDYGSRRCRRDPGTQAGIFWRVLLGSGTVTTAAEAQATIDAGAEFVVSPSLHPDVIQDENEWEAVDPGALTPTEVITAWKAGADYVKIFPCSAMGGASYLKALLAPFRF